MQENRECVHSIELGTSDQDLVSNKKARPTKTVSVFLFIIVVVLSSIIFITLYERIYVLPTPEPRHAHSQINLENILDGTYEPVRFNGSWISDSEILTRNAQGRAVLYNAATEEIRTLTPQINLESAVTMELSADGKYLLVSHSVQKLYRHSFLAQYYIVNIDTQKKEQISRNELPLLLQLVTWAPNGNGFAYVYHNNIYYRPSAESTEEFEITSDGVDNKIYNGVCDWVYEEEVFGATSALWFSPDGRKLAYASFDDSQTDIISLTYYGKPGSLEDQYPHIVSIRYPKPNHSNPIVSLRVANLESISGKNVTSVALPIPNIREPILCAVTWITADEICPTWMNRVQNQAKILSCHAVTGICDTIKSLESRTGWLDLFKPPIFSSDGSKMLFIYAHDQGSNVGNYSHVTLFNRDEQKMIPLTAGKITVTEILAWDEKDHSVYYTATEEGHPEYQHVYKTSDMTESQATPENISRIANDTCRYSAAMFSKQNSFYVFFCYGPEIPSISVFNKANNKTLTWEDNQRLKYIVKNISLPKIVYMNVPVANGMEARVKLYLPPNADLTGKTKYPLLVNVYAGPGSFLVSDKYGIGWNSYLCVNKDVIIAYIDGRGSALKGETMMHAGYRRLGTVEIEDQITVTRYLRNKFSYIDGSRIGIWGWSYGGYATGMVLATDAEDVFKCGISVAPVTDWIYYDTIYTERYMGLPTQQDNLKNYVNSSLINKARNLDKKQYMIIHGTFDDNVHYQQSMMLIRALELQDVQFLQQTYPDEEHGLSNVRDHLYHTLESFFSQCFVK